jgi:DNA-binding response OmpR family regulator
MHRLGSSRPPYALVVEGHVLIRLDAASILEDAGFKVLDVTTGDEAMHWDCPGLVDTDNAFA